MFCCPSSDEPLSSYRAIVACSGQSFGSDDFIGCLSDSMHRTVVTLSSAGCDTPGCLDIMLLAIASVDTTACSFGNEYAPECMGIFTLILTQYGTCSEISVDMTDARCTADIWADLEYANCSMVPMILASKYSSDALETDSELTYLKDAITGLSCEPCFHLFISDINALYVSDGLTACVNPYTQECRVALSDPIGAFTYCSGRELNWSATTTTCTFAEFDRLANRVKFTPLIFRLFRILRITNYSRQQTA